MKNIQPSPRIAACLLVAFLSARSIHAAPTWNNPAGGNWSVAGNWSPSGIPDTASDVIFGNIGAGTSNTEDVPLETINSLTYNQTTATAHTTVINSGQTLTINGSGAAGTALLYVGAANTTGLLVPAAITGAGGALTLNGLGNLVVRQGGVAGGSQMATLDMSGLDSFNATIGRLLVAQTQNGDTAVNRMSGTLILARTNHITLTGASPQVMVQDAQVNANGSINSVLTFGQENFINADTWRLGGQKGNARIDFNSSFSSPSLKFRNADGVSPCTVIDFGYNAAVSTGNNTVSLGDFSLGIVDIAANRINIPQGPIGTGAGSSTGTLTFGAGTVDVGDFEIGWGNATGTSGATTGTVNVNNSGILPSGAVLKASTLLRLARNNGGSAAVNGTLNLNGGTVQANSIVSGGGVSTINVNAGSTLVISNTAGTLAAPVRNFSLSDATLTIAALNGGASLAVSNLTVGGSGNVINIHSVPPIGAYPATFTLINYQVGYTAGAGPLSLGMLPPASPAYSGTLVDAGGGVIQLQLTAGPVANLGMLWTGVTDNNWDLTTFNWTFLGISTNYFDGSSPLFDDNTTQSNIVLATSLSPGSITVSNNSLQYNFTGSGNIAGAGSLTKKGSKTLIVDNAGVDTIGTVVISAGTLQIGTGGLDGGISAINITNNGALVVNRSGSVTLSSAIAGTGTLTKNGNGTLLLSGANTYSGATALNEGILQIDGTSSGAGPVTTLAGTILAGSGTVDGAVTVGGQLNPGSLTGPGTFKAHNGLTLSANSTLKFNLSATDPFNPLVNDSVEVFGNLTANNNVITVDIAGTPQNGSSYLLFTYTGTLSGSFNPVIAGTHFSMTLDTSIPGVVYLNVTGSSGADLEWASLFDSAWDSTSTNWFNLNSSLPSIFAAGDTVLLDDTNGVITTITIASGVSVFPATIIDSSTNNSFTINGAGKISGTTGIAKTGESTLTVSTPNDFTGLVDIQAGTLRTGNAAALGTTASGTIVENGATLDLNGQNLGGEVITISGGGAGGIGALINNGAGQAQALRQIVLAADATIGGTGLIGMNNSGGSASLSTGGGSYSLTKIGGNQFTLQNFTTIDAALANIDIQQGTIEFSGLTSSMGDPAFTNSVAAGATVSFAQNSIVWNKQFVFIGDGTTTTVNNGASASSELAGPVELHGDCVFNIGGTLLTISSQISGDGGLIKNGTSPLVLTGVNTYTGDTRINTAALRLNGVASISNSLNVTIVAGATLTVTGRVDSTFTLSGNQTLKGNGVINGRLTEPVGSTISPGLDAIGALTISNQVVLSGTTIMELDEAGVTNDVLRSVSTISYGGTLKLVNLGGPLSGGSTFKLFNASSYLGSFGIIDPAIPGPGQTWDTSALGTSGTIKVVSASLPHFDGTTLIGTDLVVSGSGGVASGTYYVLASTNLALPKASWTSIATNMFDVNGNFSFTNAITPSRPQRFFLLQLQ